MADPYSRSVEWVVGHAAGARTRALAVEALEAMPRYEPIPPPGVRGTEVDLVTAAVYRFSGRPRESLPYIEAADKSCFRLENPIAWMMTQRAMGDTLAALGDVLGARAAYQQVIDTWGKSRPRCVTVDEARKSLAAPPAP